MYPWSSIMNQFDNHMVVDEIWDDPEPKRCKYCKEKMDNCTCDFIE